MRDRRSERLPDLDGVLSDGYPCGLWPSVEVSRVSVGCGRPWRFIGRLWVVFVSGVFSCVCWLYLCLVFSRVSLGCVIPWCILACLYVVVVSGVFPCVCWVVGNSVTKMSSANSIFLC